MSDRRKKNRYSEEDDGRVIAPMNVAGMPWYAPKPKTPKSSAPRAYSKSLCAVSTMQCAAHPSSRSRFIIVMPSIFGMRMSVIINSGLSLRASSIPSSPLCASPTTSHPSTRPDARSTGIRRL